MKLREFYNTLFTEYPGQLGFAPAVITIAFCLVVCGTVLYGGIAVGKAVFHAQTPAAESGHS